VLIGTGAVADCQTGQVAAVHLRAARQRENCAASDCATQTQGSKLQNLRCHGTGDRESHQVSTQVAAEVGGSIIQPTTKPSESILNSLHHLSNSPLLADPNQGGCDLMSGG